MVKPDTQDTIPQVILHGHGGVSQIVFMDSLTYAVQIRCDSGPGVNFKQYLLPDVSKA